MVKVSNRIRHVYVSEDIGSWAHILATLLTLFVVNNVGLTTNEEINTKNVGYVIVDAHCIPRVHYIILEVYSVG